MSFFYDLLEQFRHGATVDALFACVLAVAITLECILRKCEPYISRALYYLLHSTAWTICAAECVVLITMALTVLVPALPPDAFQMALAT